MLRFFDSAVMHDISMVGLYLLQECWRLDSTGCAGRMMTNALSVRRPFDDAIPSTCRCHQRSIRTACGTDSFRLLGQHLDDHRRGGSSVAVQMQRTFLCSPVTLTQETTIAVHKPCRISPVSYTHLTLPTILRV